ncbi:MAG: DUF2459 domain-containing protein [Alphaproteobacteria bacterium]|nr:DUF2459 domain-containing protein [Alphaproteobacteria bacterium]
MIPAPALPRRRFLGGLAGLLALPACGDGTVPQRRVTGLGSGPVVHITSTGWHTGVVLTRADLPAGALPEAADFPDAPWLEVGWGDRDFYQTREKTLAITLAAALLPTPATIHMAGLRGPPQSVFPVAEVVTLQLAPAAFVRLVAYIDAAFDRGGAARVAANAPGLYNFSLFYPAMGTFHLLNTCNVWTARALAAAGLPIKTFGASHAEDLLVQLRAMPGVLVRPGGR